MSGYIPGEEDPASPSAPALKMAQSDQTTSQTPATEHHAMQHGPQGDFDPSFPNELEIGTDSTDQSSRDSDSSLGVSAPGSSMSLRSSIYNYLEENGRTYHAYNSGKYMLPNDEREQDRLDLQHHTFKVLLDGKLHLAPISNPKRVLDLATGTAIWAIEFAQVYPESSVLGTDLSPIQPEFVPANCRFEVDDAEDDWLFSEPFDYIHTRAIVTCFKSNRAIAQKVFENLAPGGYFEMQDPTFPIKCNDETFAGTPFSEWNDRLIESMARMGRDITDGPNWGRYMREIGFEDVTEHRFYVPVNPWARGRKNKLLGAMSQQNLTEGAESMSTAAFTRILGWSPERTQELITGVRANLADTGIHAYCLVYIAYGRKPMVAEE